MCCMPGTNQQQASSQQTTQRTPWLVLPLPVAAAASQEHDARTLTPRHRVLGARTAAHHLTAPRFRFVPSGQPSSSRTGIEGKSFKSKIWRSLFFFVFFFFLGHFLRLIVSCSTARSSKRNSLPDAAPAAAKTVIFAPASQIIFGFDFGSSGALFPPRDNGDDTIRSPLVLYQTQPETHDNPKQPA